LRRIPKERDWTVYQGFDPISEEEFLRITGCSEEAKKAASYKSSGRHRMLLGLGTSILGIAMLCKGLSEIKVESPSEGFGPLGEYPNALSFVGVAVSGIGCLMISDGALMLRGNWAPYSVAESIVLTYNKKLEAEIAGKRF